MDERRVSGEHNGLFVEERQRAIHELIMRNGKVTVEDLSATFHVSAPTIRTDLARLEDQGIVRRTHGGAIAASPTLFEPPFAQREVIRHAEKRAIARAAADLVRDGDTVLLDAGTTTYELALLLATRSRLTVVTNSLANAQALADGSGVEVILIGGNLQPRRRAMLGPLAVRFLESFHVDRGFLGFNGVDSAGGFTATDFDAAALKLTMMRCASQAVALADSGKIGQISFAKVAPLTDAALLITDRGISDDGLRQISDSGLEVLTA